MYPGDNKVFMKCDFLEMVRFDARVKHGYKKKNLILPALCWDGREAEGNGNF